MVRTISHKIVPLEQLANAQGVLCHGCFDILHIGHVRQIRQARHTYPDWPLIVTLTADLYINKGSGRPVFPASVRAEVMAALEDVTYVAVCEEATGLTAIMTIRPRVYVKGIEYSGRGGIAQLEREAVELRGGKMLYTNRYGSSTDLVTLVEHNLKGL